MKYLTKDLLFDKIFRLSSVLVGGLALILAVAVLLFVNEIISLPMFCLIAVLAFAGTIASFYFTLKSMILPVKIQSKKSQQIEAVGHLAAGFAHEYNNMFAVVLGAAEVLRRTVTIENQEYVEIILRTIKRLSHLTNQLFGAARKKKIEMIAVDMHQTLQSVIQIFTKNRTPNICFHEDFQAESWNIMGNQSQIRNALINLGTAAVEAIGSKQGSVYFRTRTTEFSMPTNIGVFTVQAGNYFTVSIEDTGEGYSTDQMESIFDPYFSVSENKGNLGIRLASVLATLSNHSGALLVQSKENHGTTFTIYLPFSEKSQQAKSNSETTSISSEKNNAQYIMIVDDDPLVRKVVTAMLQRIGYSVLVAESGFEAIDIYAEQCDEVALVILDMVMPNMDGASCFYELKAINPSVKVLISSGSIDNSSIEDMAKDGLCGFITKPYSYAELEKVVTNALQI